MAAIANLDQTGAEQQLQRDGLTPNDAHQVVIEAYVTGQSGWAMQGKEITVICEGGAYSLVYKFT